MKKDKKMKRFVFSMKDKEKKLSVIALIVFVVCVCVGTLISFLFPDFFQTDIGEAVLVILLVVPMITICMQFPHLFFDLIFGDAHKTFVEIQKIYTNMLTDTPSSEEETTDSSESSASESAKLYSYDLDAHFTKNWSQLLAYYTMSERQAAVAFRWAIFLAVVGIALIAFAILSPYLFNLTEEYNLVPVIGSISGAVVEIFAGTILVVYIKTLSQMKIYHTALADHHRYLSCACLANGLSERTRDTMISEIIRKEMEKPSYAETYTKKQKVSDKNSANG